MELVVFFCFTITITQGAVVSRGTFETTVFRNVLKLV